MYKSTPATPSPLVERPLGTDHVRPSRQPGAFLPPRLQQMTLSAPPTIDVSIQPEKLPETVQPFSHCTSQLDDSSEPTIRLSSVVSAQSVETIQPFSDDFSKPIVNVSSAQSVGTIQLPVCNSLDRSPPEIVRSSPVIVSPSSTFVDLSDAIEESVIASVVGSVQISPIFLSKFVQETPWHDHTPRPVGTYIAYSVWKRCHRYASMPSDIRHTSEAGIRYCFE